MNFSKNLFNGIIPENPIFKLMLGLCPTLAVTTAAMNGLGMGLATMVVLVGSNVVISLIKKQIPDKIRIPAFIVIIASFVTIVGMLLKAYFPDLDKALGIFIPLIVVNCVILARAESFASKNDVLNSLADGIGMGLGFTLSLTILGSIRELFGAGSIFGISVFGGSFEPAIMMILPPGAFLTLGLLLGLLNKVSASK
ncbi:RnfABCDGE type electron transport complex subunit E [Alkalibacter saccharofermentans]|jgi:electron transport complex protein RnfE|uniref:Ion-translocating oxidoreductase complex subunit E n=1 Tax=Alkalibacter saccharofermentans DSM 14828 TaxID=1120975 RepID=A0A1M4VG42_9FIRM|nr:electron transport complex subunit E [Alkalibacter saccharofermentans]SHE67872.1 electron transport complex protein RnfE [Alkalibacter saccharofermentans DSM 14828]